MMTGLLIFHLLVTIGMVGLVLLQRSEGGGLGIGGGGGGGFMTTRGTANALSRATVTMAILFFITSISLSFIAGVQRSGGGTGSVTDSAQPAQQTQPLGLPGESPDQAPAEPADAPEDDGLPDVPVGD